MLLNGRRTRSTKSQETTRRTAPTKSKFGKGYSRSVKNREPQAPRWSEPNSALRRFPGSCKFTSRFGSVLIWISLCYLTEQNFKLGHYPQFIPSKDSPKYVYR